LSGKNPDNRIQQSEKNAQKCLLLADPEPFLLIFPVCVFITS